MKHRSLRVRLLAGAAIAILAALAASWYAMTILFERHVERNAEADLTRQALELVAGLQLAPDGSPRIEPAPADPRFDDPAGGLYWQASTSAGDVRSRSLWDQALSRTKRVSTQDWATRFADGPFEHRVILLEREVRPDPGGAGVLVQLAQDAAGLRAASAAFGRELALFLGLLWAILTIASWIQVELGLRPLRRVRAELAAMKRNPSERLAPPEVAEIAPLVAAINSLAEARERDLAQARRRASDLAHGLKTPLAALSALSRRASEAGASDVAEGLGRVISATRGAVETELARARVATVRRGSGVPGEARLVVEKIVGVLEHTDFGAQVVYDVDVAEDLGLPIMAEDLNELLGPLLENAARHARRRVRIAGSAHAGARLVIEDDGAGMNPVEVQRFEAAPGRLDEVAAPQGRGLRIARSLVEATEGRLMLGQAPLGGLCVTLAWSLDDDAETRA